MKCFVAGAGGAIGGHLVRYLVDQGYEVRGADIKPPGEWWQWDPRADNVHSLDLRNPKQTYHSINGSDMVFNLAENMGGIGFITNNRIECTESIEIGINMLRQSALCGVKKFTFASSACIYPISIQEDQFDIKLSEDMAWPAEPEDGYGLMKLYMEELCRFYSEETPLRCQIARLHNVYGSHSSWEGGREKSPAALCRKVAEAKLTGGTEVEIWNDGTQIRSYLHVKDCVDGLLRLSQHSPTGPVNLGSDIAVSISGLLEIVQIAAGTHLNVVSVEGPRGVAYRNADIDLARQILKWEPSVRLDLGISQLYRWVEKQVEAKLSDTSNGHI